jgi:RNA recognition motif-containing protein
MNIYVGNIPRETSEAELKEAFEQYGEVATVNLIKDKYTNIVKGFAFVEMPKTTEAEAAIKSLDGTMFNGRALTVNPAKPKTERSDKPRRYKTGY